MAFPHSPSRPLGTHLRPPVAGRTAPSFTLPAAAQRWPRPAGPARSGHWLQPEGAFRAFLAEVIREQGEDALALIWHDGPRTAHSPLTRWFCPGVPIHTSGHQVQRGAHTLHGYYLPARAALQAASCGLVRFAGEEA